MPEDLEDENEPLAWYCVRAKPKSEHLAAAHLRRADVVEVFCPRIRFQKATQRGKVWFVEALFPGYLFARFALRSQLRRINALPAVSGVVHFGDHFPVLEETRVAELREKFDDAELRVVEAQLKSGDEVDVVDGPLKGLSVLVTRVLPGRERVRILLEWLGEAREVEIGREVLVRRGDVRERPGE